MGGRRREGGGEIVGDLHGRQIGAAEIFKRYSIGDFVGAVAVVGEGSRLFRRTDHGGRCDRNHGIFGLARARRVAIAIRVGVCSVGRQIAAVETTAITGDGSLIGIWPGIGVRSEHHGESYCCSSRRGQSVRATQKVLVQVAVEGAVYSQVSRRKAADRKCCGSRECRRQIVGYLDVVDIDIAKIFQGDRVRNVVGAVAIVDNRSRLLGRADHRPIAEQQQGHPVFAILGGVAVAIGIRIGSAHGDIGNGDAGRAGAGHGYTVFVVAAGARNFDGQQDTNMGGIARVHVNQRAIDQRDIRIAIETCILDKITGCRRRDQADAGEGPGYVQSTEHGGKVVIQRDSGDGDVAVVLQVIVDLYVVFLALSAGPGHFLGDADQRGFDRDLRDRAFVGIVIVVEAAVADQAVGVRVGAVRGKVTGSLG